jgi:hypothetical protein
LTVIRSVSCAEVWRFRQIHEMHSGFWRPRVLSGSVQVLDPVFEG